MTRRIRIGTAAALLLLTACGEGVPPIDTSEAEVALADMVTAAGFPDATTLAVLDECPITDGQLLLERAFADVDSAFLRLALEADPIAFVTAPNQDPAADPYVGCGRLTNDGIGVVLSIADSPGAGVDTIDTEFNPAPGTDESDALHDATAERYAARFGDPPEHLTIDRGISTRGGTFARICIAEPQRPERDSCEAAWLGGDLVVSAAATGPGALDVDLDAVEERLRPLLQLVTDGLTDAG